MERISIADPPGFAELSKAEKVRYLQELWDRISEQPEDVPVLESHLALAEERIAESSLVPKKSEGRALQRGLQWVRAVGLEPTTNGLRVRCSTIELCPQEN